MAYQTVFRRYELKYLITAEQKDRILTAMEPHMRPDSYGRTVIRNLYFDTENWRLIRRSMEKPLYKEKLRIRSYALATADSTVFVELKKKFDGVVYKRRLPMAEQQAMQWICEGTFCGVDSQIRREVDYFRTFYGELRPTVFLSYAREAYYGRENADFRVTFDESILCRENALTLREEPGGQRILPEGSVLMELKCGGGIPLWLCELLSREKIFKTAFSKYGKAYETIIYPKRWEKK